MNLEKCETISNYKEYLKTKAENHNYLKIYGPKDNIEKIVRDGTLFFSDGSDWNDTDDFERMQKESCKKLILARSFSFSKSESVAMWMLYAGGDDDLMINFRPKTILSLMTDKPVITVGRFEKSGFVEIMKISSDNYEFDFTDMIYVDTKSDKTAIKRSDERVESVSRKTIEEFGMLSKSYPWYYENECRLMIYIDKAALDNQKINAAKVPISFSERDYGIFHNPQKTDNYIYNTSTLQGTMKWNIRCKRDCPLQKGDELYLHGDC